MTIKTRTVIRSLIGIVTLAALCLTFMLGTSASQSHKTIHYRTVTMPFPPEFGVEGWELVFIIQQSGTLIFRRS